MEVNGTSVHQGHWKFMKFGGRNHVVYARTNSHAVTCVLFDHLVPLEIFGIYFIQTHPILPPNFFNTHHVHGSMGTFLGDLVFYMFYCFLFGRKDHCS